MQPLRTASFYRNIRNELFLCALGCLFRGALCGLLPREENPEAAEPFEGEMLILCSLNGSKAGNLLSALKRFRLFFPLKAVATPTNIHWQAPQLYRELSAEREAIANHQKPAHQEEPSC